MTTPSLTATDLTTAERRALAQLRTAGGRFAVIAADHGDPLVDMLDRLGLPSAPAAQRAFKRDLVGTVGRDASAVLLDPDVSLPALVDEDVLARDVGLLVRIEADGHDEVDGLRRSNMIGGLGAAGARARGATAAKVMVFLRADCEDSDGYTARLVRGALADCRAHDLLCVIELMTYRLDDEAPEAFAARKPDLVREGAVLLQELGSPVLKLEYPGSTAECERVTDALGVPWAVLSAGVDHPAFCDQLRSSVEGGADGFIAGRSLWKEAVGLPEGERRAFLADTGPAPDGRDAGDRLLTLLLGIDVGTTFCKAVVTDAAGRVLGEGRAPTPWTPVATGAEAGPHDLVAASRRAAAAALAAAPPGRVEGIGVAGMAETGVLLDAAGRPLAPAIAWHDRRGAAEARELAAALPAFSHHTGLAPGPLCTLAKLAGQRDLRPARWLGVPEWVAHRLGAAPAAEWSLASRTGLFDVAAGAWWAPALDWLDAPRELLAPPVAAGTRLGRTRGGAAIAVAGHDHVVAMVGAGALGADDVLHSAGTSEAYVRTSAPLEPERAVAAGLSAGRHVLPDRFALIGGGGMSTPLSTAARALGDVDALDAAAAALPHGAESDPAPTPAQVWRATAEAVAALGADVVARGDAVAGPHGRIVAVGGGVRWQAVRAAKERRLGAVAWSPVGEATARGAALIGGLAAGVFAGWDELAAVVAPVWAGAT